MNRGSNCEEKVRLRSLKEISVLINNLLFQIYKDRNSIYFKMLWAQSFTSPTP